MILEFDLMCVQHEQEIELRSNERISYVKNHPLTGFCSYLVTLLFNIFPIKLFIFILNVMDYFVIIKVVVAS